MPTRLSTTVVPAAVLILAALALPASAQTQSAPLPKPQFTLTHAAHGAIQGVVLDIGRGTPLAGAMVSALGATVAFAVSGRDGRFLLEALPPGAYTVRVHLDGFAPSRRQVVEVRGPAPAQLSVGLQPLNARALVDNRAVILAGFGPVDDGGTADGATTDAAGGLVDEHDHTATAWRLRHLKRNVLKSVDDAAILPEDVEPLRGDEASRFGRLFESSLRSASSWFADLPLSGQVNVFTTGSFAGESEIDVPDAFEAAGIAYLAIGAPVGRSGEWLMRGAMTQGALASWFLTGTYTGRITRDHRVTTGFAYGAQQLEPLNVFGRAAMQGGTRAIGSVSAYDSWAVGRTMTLDFGASYAWQDYLVSNPLLSPRVAITITPVRQVRLRATAARTMVAPGADELLPGANLDEGAWLPAQRSFSAWSDPVGLRPQATDHVELSFDRVAGEFVIGLRTFYQRTDDQMGTVFAAPTLDRPAATIGHYYVATVGDATAHGWGFRVSRPLYRGLSGAVDYSQTTATWKAFDGAVTAPSWYGSTSRERFHDLTTSLQTSIPQTATRVFVLYRINTAFASDTSRLDSVPLDSRFDVQVNQGLPFMGFTSADWEVLVAVRNLFRDPTSERSVFDELLVVRPPTRVVGGVRVRF